MRQRPMVMIYTGTWDDATLDALSAAVDRTQIEAAEPLAPGAAMDRVIVVEPGGRVIDGAEQVARILRWAELTGADPAAVVVRVLLATHAAPAEAARQVQEALPGISRDALFNWGSINRRAEKTASGRSKRPDGCPACGGAPDGQGGAGFVNGFRCGACGGSGWKNLREWERQRDEDERQAADVALAKASAERAAARAMRTDEMFICPTCGIELAAAGRIPAHRPGVGNIASCPGAGHDAIKVSRPPSAEPQQRAVSSAKSDVRRLKREVQRAESRVTNATRAAKRQGVPARQLKAAKTRQATATHRLAEKQGDLRRAEERLRQVDASRRGGAPLFPLGRLVSTPAALSALVAAEQTPDLFLRRHHAGDWGEVAPDSKKANDAAVHGGDRILSIYTLRTGERIWIITEADRSATTVLLPSDY